MGTQR